MLFTIVGIFFFFFSSRRRHTRLQGDWSSDVCSSDLTTVPTPAEHDQDRGEAAGGAAHDQPGAPETEARIEEQQRVEREKADGERRERPAERPHRTGWRRAGRTMNGELATAPRAARAVGSSSTCPPLNFTT